MSCKPISDIGMLIDAKMIDSVFGQILTDFTENCRCQIEEESPYEPQQ